MATKKKSRAKTASKRPKAKVVKKKKVVKQKKTVAKAKAKPVAKKAAPVAKASGSAALKDRRMPETLRLKSFTPSLTVNDLAKSIAFYGDGLGFFVGEKWMDGDVLRGVMLKAGAMEFGLSQDDGKLGADRKKGQGFRIYCNTAQDPDALASRLKAAGYSLKDEPADHPEWGVRTFSVDDPDGFHLTVARDL